MYYRPGKLTEALELKAQLGPKGVLLAGGTDLLAGIAKGRMDVRHWIDLSRLEELTVLQREGKIWRIGASCTHARLETLPILAIAQAARAIGSPQIRNRGTVGGNLGTASPAGDLSVALLACAAAVELLSCRGARRVELSEFFLAPGRTMMAPDELIVAVYVPEILASDFRKLGKRQAVAISVVCAAVARLATGAVLVSLGSVAPTPLRAKSSEDFLAKHGLSASNNAQAAQLVSAEVQPIDDQRASAAYRRAMSGVLTRRLLDQLLEK
ncbi:MAG: FAD binding domain-containing protein [Cyanobacteria bacterium NC_groundwater_1444_Ag_S-0.65um_54_12]|nr:FAD binding domain-containing protein [Cyanobacteria bacterium NC_groundwater_1444_Ag_S-0.65um_54_12]